MAKGSTSTLLIVGGIGVAVYYYWAQIAAELATLGITLPGSTAATTTTTTTAPAGAQVTNSSPTINTAGAVALGPNGCFIYNNLVSCPPGVNPPAAAAPQNNCGAGYQIDASGVCTLYSDAALLAGLNSIPWSGSTAIPTEQISRIDPSVLAEYGSTTGVNPGTVLAYMLGLGGSGSSGQSATGTDGNIYVFTSGVWQRQTAGGTLSGFRGTRLAAVAQALPVTNQLLQQASHDPDTAAIVGNDQRALLTVPQWNYFYAQASGVVQTIPQHPAGDPGARVNAQTYQQIRQAAGHPVRLGTLRPAAKGAFPLGGISTGPSRIPFTFPGNRNIYRIPGQGAVIQQARKTTLGVITQGGGNHRWTRSPFPRPADWRRAQ